MELRARHGDFRKARAEFAALFVFEDEKLFRRQSKALSAFLHATPPPLENGSFSAKQDQSLLVYPHGSPVGQLLLVGLGKLQDLQPERLRRAAAAAIDAAQRARAKTLTLIDPFSEGAIPGSGHLRAMEPEAAGQAFGEGAALGGYSYERFFTDTSRKARWPRRVEVLCGTKGRLKGLAEGLRFASIIARGTCSARDLVNTPGNALYPARLAEAAKRAGKEHGIAVSVLNERRIAALNMGGLIGVSRGSANPPRFVIMDYRGRRASRRSLHGPIVLVGKGVTFDSGGISIKPSAGMGEMKTDMAGAAAVIGAMQIAASFRLPVRLIGLIPIAENLPSGTALKPGDVITHLNGTTSEVENTDAEGRLILADALAFAERYAPKLVIDLATLTGACVVALGHLVSGMMGNDPHAMKLLSAAGDETGERVWQLPMHDEYDKLIRSDIADVKNTGGRWAGAITAACFLKKFVGSSRWVHIDIAGTAFAEESSGYTPKGATGVGVRLLTEFLRHHVSSY